MKHLIYLALCVVIAHAVHNVVEYDMDIASKFLQSLNKKQQVNNNFFGMDSDCSNSTWHDQKTSHLELTIKSQTPWYIYNIHLSIFNHN